jgi:branched-chain amino acid transport system permease protein
VGLRTWSVRYVGREILALPGRVAALLFVIAAVVFPLVTREPYYLRVATLAALFIIFAASWDFLSGYTGQISFGHALFFGGAAYTSALFNVKMDLPLYFSIPLGALAATIAGVLVGIPCLRLRGPYLALVTLAFPLILTGLVFLFGDITGGELGLSGLDRLAGTRTQEYIIAGAVMLFSVGVMWKITQTRVGLFFHAIREDEVAARAAGINTTFYKLLAFALSGFFAGVAGALYAHYVRIAGPDVLSMLFSFQPVIWTIFGGPATIYGAVTGVVILFPALEYMRNYPQYRFLSLAVLIVVVLRFLPEGVARRVREIVEPECPRCKTLNVWLRDTCRACGATLGQVTSRSTTVSASRPA